MSVQVPFRPASARDDKFPRDDIQILKRATEYLSRVAALL
jgi:hypothetical protein